jgi:hypothetical protein
VSRHQRTFATVKTVTKADRLAFGVEEVGDLASHVVDIEADCPEDPHERALRCLSNRRNFSGARLDRMHLRSKAEAPDMPSAPS